MNVISVLGGKVHTRQDFPPAYEGQPEFSFPLCRTGSMTNRGTKYRDTDAAVTCTVCLSYSPTAPEAETEPQEEAFFAPEESEAYLIGEKKQDQEQDQAAPVATREEWLHRAIEALRPRYEQVGMPLPERLHVSVGFASKMQRIGECWARRMSADGVNHIFISPELNEASEVLGTLVHELIHAADDCKNGHKGPFRKAAVALGLEGKMTATIAGKALAAQLRSLAAEIGPYPHGVLYTRGVPVMAPKPSSETDQDQADETETEETPSSSAPKKQTARMIKVMCSEDCECEGYTFRTTQKWIEVGLPNCPFGGEMSVA
ncbi:hypothetical protein ACFCZT_07840 [Streptomyces sp. NPDC056230]|uniref:hypothetical protein n=1 Tax=Streptomyces sp. NPDC056230 TaxID=3345754 RepID=UPI0035DF4A6D